MRGSAPMMEAGRLFLLRVERKTMFFRTDIKESKTGEGECDRKNTWKLTGKKALVEVYVCGGQKSSGKAH